MKKLFLIMVGALLLNVSAKADGVAIEVGQLPQAARVFIEKHFADRQVSLAQKDTELFDNSYDVYFTNGDKLEFDKKGEWKEVDCRNSAVPAEVVPAAIKSLVTSKYPDVRITQIERKSSTKGYEVKLSNGLELEFNKAYQLVGIDD